MWFLFTRRLSAALLVSYNLVIITTVIFLVFFDLTTDEAPAGIITLELAGSAAKAATIINSWTTELGSLYRAYGSLLVDSILFIPAYSTALGLGCWWGRGVVARNGGGRWLLPVTWLAWGQTVAGALDYVENFAILNMLNGSIHDPWPWVATGCALVKFFLIGVGLMFISSTMLYLIISNLSGAKPNAQP